MKQIGKKNILSISLFLILVVSSIFYMHGLLAQTTNIIDPGTSTDPATGGEIIDPRTPTCGYANGKTFTAIPPTTQLCPSNEVATGMSANNSGWSWQCALSDNMANKVSCSASLQRQSPVCGSANGQVVTVAPTGASLCPSGETVIDLRNISNGWAWRCAYSSNLSESVGCAASLDGFISPINPGTGSSGSGGSSYSNNNVGGVVVRIYSPASGTRITSGTLNLVIQASNADRVELSFRKNGSSSFEYLGSFNRDSSGNWKLQVDNSMRIPNGRYYFMAKAFKNGSVYESSNNYYLDISFEDGSMSSPIESSMSYGDMFQSETSGSSNDTDGDGLSNEKEKAIGTNPNLSDTDKDKLSDSEELRRGTNPKNPDTDRDGFLDGDEVAGGFNPLKYSPGDGRDKIVFENPKEKGDVSREYSVEKVDMVHSKSGKKNLSLSGKGLPNSFVTLYIYSEPIVVTVKTDADGNWVYELDKEFEDGEHEAYVAVTDNTGKITSKSEPTRFVKTAEAATVIPSAQAQTDDKGKAPTEKSRNNFAFFAFVIAVIFLGIALAVVGVMNRKSAYEQQ